MLRIEIEQQDRIMSALRELGDPSLRAEVMEDIGSYGVTSTQQRFLEQKSPDGEGWEKSSRAKSKGGQTLRDRGNLFDSLTYSADSNSVAWGTNLIYAAIHQYGGEIKAKNGGKLKFKVGGHFVQVDKVDMPARPYLGLTDEDEAEITDIVQLRLSEVF